MRLFLFLLVLTLSLTAHAQTFIKGPALIESIYEFTPGPTIPITAAFNTIVHGTGVGTQTITLPDATTLTVGRRFAFDNGLSGNMTIQDAGANTLFTVLPGQNIVARLYANGSANGSWYIEQNAINLANNLQALGTLPVGSGGTGSTSFAADSIPYSNGTILTENNTGFNYNLTNERLTINADGASAAAPPANTRLHLIGNNGSPSRLVSDVYNGSSVQGPYFLGRRARGTAASPAAVQNGDVLSAFAGTGYGTTAFDAANGSAIVSLKAQGTWTDTSAPSYIQLFTTPSASTTAVQRLKVDSTGSVVVGNNSSALATTATDGFLYISSSAGIPTGVPTTQTGSLPIHIDSTNSELYFYSGSWLKAISGTATVPEGGTGATTLTDRGVLIGRGTAAIEATAAGSAGQVLQSGGAGANPSYSTATYPGTAGTANTILRSDGTNIVNSTPTFPNTATANKVLVGDGTNIVLSTPTFSQTPTSGTYMRGDGTNWITSTLILPNSATAGGVAFATASNTIGEDATNFFWDDSNDRLYIRANSSYDPNNSAIQSNLTGATSGGLGLNAWTGTNVNSRGIVQFNRSRGTSNGSYTIVASGDSLGALVFRGSNGSSFDTAAVMAVASAGTPGASNDMPGRFEFYTSPDGSSGPLERMRIDADGGIFLYNIINDTPGNNVQYNTTSKEISYTVSSRRIKENIVPVEQKFDTSKIFSLEVVAYKERTESSKELIGLIAEQAAEVAPELAIYGFWNGNKIADLPENLVKKAMAKQVITKAELGNIEYAPLNVNDRSIQYAMLKEMQKLKARVDELEARLGGK